MLANLKKNYSFKLEPPKVPRTRSQLSTVQEEFVSKNCPIAVPEMYIPVAKKTVDATWPKAAKSGDFALSMLVLSFLSYINLLTSKYMFDPASKSLVIVFYLCKATDYFPVQDTCKGADGFSNQIFTGVMTFVMGIVTMVRMTRNMPRKITDATFYSNGSVYGVESMIKGHAYELPAPSISSADYFTMMKRMAELEDKMTVLVNKPQTMPPEKEEKLNNALSRVDALEQELASAKKALDEALVRQEELLAYIEKKKKKKKFFGF